ncbi:MAG: ABC transporter permease subunit, partial [Deltaproteobacteria bacterium]|nr:ABC transporter permease subunit [Deltaproteobacteria bacterium]
MGLSAAEWFAVRLSLQVSLAAVVLALPLAVALSLLLIRRPFRGRVLLEAVIMAPLVVPPVVTGYLLLLAVGPHTVPGTIFRRIFGGDLAFAPAGAVLAAAVVSFPLVFRPVRAALEGVDPTYVNVSRSLGVGRVRTFLRVVLPMAWPGMLTGAVLGFARSLGEFGATIMVAGNIPFRT